MPRGDRTGPLGQGAMTGRRAGYCAGYERPGYMHGGGFGYGRGWGRGFGFGRGFGRFRGGTPIAPMVNVSRSPDTDSVEMLREEVAGLQSQLSMLLDRIGEMSEKSEKPQEEKKAQK